MTTYSHEAIAERELRLSRLILSLPPYDIEAAVFSLDGEELILEGRVDCYDAKCRLEAAARSAGFSVRNGLRVVPAIAHFESPFSPVQGSSQL